MPTTYCNLEKNGGGGGRVAHKCHDICKLGIRSILLRFLGLIIIELLKYFETTFDLFCSSALDLSPF